MKRISPVSLSSAAAVASVAAPPSSGFMVNDSEENLSSYLEESKG